MHDPAVDTVIAFVGGRRHRATPARMFVALEGPSDSARSRADQVIARLRKKLGQHPRRARCSSRRCRISASAGGRAHAQYQYTLQGDNLDELNAVGAAGARRAAQAPRAGRREHRPAEPRLQAWLDDRPRHRLAPRHHAADDRRHALRRLRPAAGLDDVHAAEPVPRRHGGRPAFWQNPDGAAEHLRARGAAARRCRSARSPTTRRRRRRSPSTTRASFRPSRFPSTCRPASRSATRSTRSTRPSAKWACRRQSHGSFQGTAQAFQASLASEPLLILAALVDGLHRARAFSTRATSTRSRSSRRCPRPAWARCSRC